MSEPVIAQKAPYALELEPGQYWWCACGRSATQPFCDGSHSGSEFSPLPFDIAETKKVWLCGCKHAKTQPYCDGTHKGLV
jgi:CDGSH-type Zn-finger protein